MLSRSLAPPLLRACACPIICACESFTVRGDIQYEALHLRLRLDQVKRTTGSLRPEGERGVVERMLCTHAPFSSFTLSFLLLSLFLLLHHSLFSSCFCTLITHVHVCVWKWADTDRGRCSLSCQQKYKGQTKQTECTNIYFIFPNSNISHILESLNGASCTHTHTHTDTQHRESQCTHAQGGRDSAAVLITPNGSIRRTVMINPVESLLLHSVTCRAAALPSCSVSSHWLSESGATVAPVACRPHKVTWMRLGSRPLLWIQCTVIVSLVFVSVPQSLAVRFHRHEQQTAILKQKAKRYFLEDGFGSMVVWWLALLPHSKAAWSPCVCVGLLRELRLPSSLHESWTNPSLCPTSAGSGSSNLRISSIDNGWMDYVCFRVCKPNQSFISSNFTLSFTQILLQCKWLIHFVSV